MLHLRQFGMLSVIGTITLMSLLILPPMIGTLVDETSLDLGANGFQTFRHVILPNIGTSLFAGGMLAFALSRYLCFYSCCCLCFRCVYTGLRAHINTQRNENSTGATPIAQVDARK